MAACFNTTFLIYKKEELLSSYFLAEKKAPSFRATRLLLV
jgi:hypothetical protein